MSRINTVEGAFSYESDISYMRNTADLPQAHKATAFHWKNIKKYYLGTKIISYTIQITIDIWQECNVSSWTIIKPIYPQHNNHPLNKDKVWKNKTVRQAHNHI